MAARGDERQTVLMCAACWKIQVPEDDLAFAVEDAIEQWVDPNTFIALASAANTYEIVDGYCEACLSDLFAQERGARIRHVGERLNA